MKVTLTVLIMAFSMMLSGCSNPKGDLEKLGIPYTQDAFFEKGVYKQNKKIIRLFLKAGLDVEATDKGGDTALYISAYHGNFEIIKMIVDEFDGNVNSRNKNGYDIISVYLEKNIGNYDSLVQVVPYLMKHGATFNLFSRIANNSLVRIINLGDVNRGLKNDGELRILEFMFEHGYDVNTRTKHSSGQSYLTAAAYEFDFKLMNLLLKYNVDVNYQEADGDTVLHTIYQRFGQSHDRCWGCDKKYWKKEKDSLNERAPVVIEMMEKIIAKGGSLDIKNKNGETAFESMSMSAGIVKSNWIIDLVKFAVAHGSDINAKNEKGENVFYKLFDDGYEIENIKATVAYFLENGADPLLNTNFEHRGQRYNALEAFCLDMNSLSWSERNTHPKICTPRNVDNFKKFFTSPNA